MGHDRKPDFIIIGTTKGGTSWIVSNLAAQQQVAIPTAPQAGLHYFSRHYGKGTEWYLNHFSEIDSSVELVGEKSASYLPHPDVPGRIHALVPDVRLICQLRNPVDRAYSDYCMHVRRGQASADIDRYLDPENSPIPRLVGDGLYHKHLSSYLDVFGPDQLLVTIYEEMEQYPERVLTSITGFLGIDNPVIPDDLSRRVKSGSVAMLPLAMRKYLAPFKGMVAPYRQTAAFRSVHSFFAKPNRYPPLTDALRQRLWEFYRPDIEALSAYLGRELHEWDSHTRLAA